MDMSGVRHRRAWIDRLPVWPPPRHSEHDGADEHQYRAGRMEGEVNLQTTMGVLTIVPVGVARQKH